MFALDCVVKFVDGGSGSEENVSLPFWRRLGVSGYPSSRFMAGWFSLASLVGCDSMLGVTVMAWKSPSLRRIGTLCQSWTDDGLYNNQSGIGIFTEKRIFKVLSIQAKHALCTLLVA